MGQQPGDPGRKRLRLSQDGSRTQAHKPCPSKFELSGFPCFSPSPHLSPLLVPFLLGSAWSADGVSEG
jgi:hypothetical protein